MSLVQDISACWLGLDLEDPRKTYFARLLSFTSNISNPREAEWSTAPDLHLVTSETSLIRSGNIQRHHSRARGATPSYPGHDATNELNLLYYAPAYTFSIQ